MCKKVLITPISRLGNDLYRGGGQSAFKHRKKKKLDKMRFLWYCVLYNKDVLLYSSCMTTWHCNVIGGDGCMYIPRYDYTPILSYGLRMMTRYELE